MKIKEFTIGKSNKVWDVREFGRGRLTANATAEGDIIILSDKHFYEVGANKQWLRIKDKKLIQEIKDAISG